MPVLGGAYGGYIGMAGSWSYWLGCKGGFIAFSSANAAQAHTNFTKYHTGVGDGAYWFMGGPGVDPNWNGSASEAYNWGARQGARALAGIANGALGDPGGWVGTGPPRGPPPPDNGADHRGTPPCPRAIKRQHH